MNASKRNVCGVILASDLDEEMNIEDLKAPRGMLTIGGKPILLHQIEQMKKIGIKNIVLLVGLEKEKIEKYFEDGKKYDIKIQYVIQSKSLGIAHAVGQLEKYINSPFVLSLSSLFFVTKKFDRLMRNTNNSSIRLATQKSNDVNFSELHYEILLNGNRSVKQIIEKPRYIVGPFKGCGIYYFDPIIFDAIRRTPRTAMRDQYEIADSIQILIQDGFSVKAIDVIEWYMHINSQSDLKRCALRYERVQ